MDELKNGNNQFKQTTIITEQLNQTIAILFLGLLSFSVAGQQNLVRNGSFEEYIECPQSANYGTALNYFGIKDWWQPASWTPDYFNSCNGGGGVGTPHNFWGYQQPFHGNAYAGFIGASWTYEYGSEYLQTRLKKTVCPEGLYKIRFYVSLANYSKNAIARIGVWITNDSTKHQQSVRIIENPCFENPENNIIADTAAWKLLEGIFSPGVQGQFLTIGYYEETTSDSFFIQNNWTIGTLADNYFYIDSVSLIELSSPCAPDLPNVFTPNNDDVNDVLRTDPLHGFSYYKVHIASRWGNKVAELTPQYPTWDGKNQQGQECADGVYFYVYRAVDDSGIEVNGKGTVQLFR